RVWLPLKDFRASGITRKLHDGILTNEAETIAIILESSGSEAAPHVVDDTYKQLKSSSDFLKHIITKAILAIYSQIAAIYFLAFLKHIVEGSLAEIDRLEDESLGYIDLGSDEVLVKDFFI
ncbi:hypothetical protein INT47_002098, partial [Mucor saturninus]